MKRRELLGGRRLDRPRRAPCGRWCRVAWRHRPPGRRPTHLLDRLCDLVIPDTDTPGARAAGVPAFVALAMQHALADATPADRLALQQRLDKAAGGAFLALDAAHQHAVLAPLDAATFARNPAAAAGGEGAWRPLKALIVMGYYSSEVGGAQELQYELVPGPSTLTCLSNSHARWSSDWTGVKYG